MHPTISDFDETSGNYRAGHSVQNDTCITELGLEGQKLWSTKNRHFCVHSSVKIYQDFDLNI